MESSLGELLRGLVRAQLKESGLCPKGNVGLLSVAMFFKACKVDKMWPTGEGNGKPLQYSCLENPMNTMKRQNDRILKEELPGSVGAQYATGYQWRNNSRKNEGKRL